MQLELIPTMGKYKSNRPFRWITLLIILSMIYPSSTLAATRQSDLGVELLKDLQKRISDSTSIPISEQQIMFQGDPELTSYFDNLLRGLTSLQNLNSDSSSSIQVDIISYSITINKDTSETVWNMNYLRQLQLNTIYRVAGLEQHWDGRIGDKISKTDLKDVINEPIPISLTGDFRMSEPSSIGILLTGLSIFTLISALYFMRT